MKKCILCKNDTLVTYGDDIYGEVFCKDCYNQYNCLHCNRMNILIQFDNSNDIIEVIIKQFFGMRVSNNSILLPLFKQGYQFKLYCKECWQTQDMYNDDEDDISIEPEEDDIDSYISEDENNDWEDNNNINSYYTGKGKYDLY